MRLTIFILFILFLHQTMKAQSIHESNGLFYADSVLFTGVYKNYHENLQLKTEMNLVEGKKEGITRIYFDDGKLKEIRAYNNNFMNGKWYTYNQQGAIIAEAGYNNGKKDGIWKIRDDNGTLRVEMFYKDGEKKGIWRRWDEHGKLIGEVDYH